MDTSPELAQLVKFVSAYSHMAQQQQQQQQQQQHMSQSHSLSYQYTAKPIPLR